MAAVSKIEVLLLWRALRQFRSGKRPGCAPWGQPPSSARPSMPDVGVGASQTTIDSRSMRPLTRRCAAEPNGPAHGFLICSAQILLGSARTPMCPGICCPAIVSSSSYYADPRRHHGVGPLAEEIGAGNVRTDRYEFRRYVFGPRRHRLGLQQLRGCVRGRQWLCGRRPFDGDDAALLDGGRGGNRS